MTMHIVGFFCEDIREEKNGQLTIVGTLPDNVQVPPPPSSQEPRDGRQFAAIMPKLGIYIRVRVPLDIPPIPMKVSLSLPNGSSIVLGNVDSEIISKSKREAQEKGLSFGGLIFHAVMQGFQFGSAGLVSAVVEWGDNREICAQLNLIMPPATLST